jgi:hypothetical protein
MRGAPANRAHLWSSVSAAFIEDHKFVAPGTILFAADAGASSCTVETTLSPVPSAGGTEVSAGTITVTGAGAPIALTPMTGTLNDGGSAVGYTPALNNQLDGGNVSLGGALAIVGSGATVPAFSTTVAVPGSVTLTQPELVDASTFTISRSADLPLAWTGGGPAGTLSFEVEQIASTTVTIVVCTFPENAGSGVVPAAALSYLTPSSNLDAGPAGATSVGVLLLSSQVVTVSDWTIGVSVQLSLEVGIGTKVTVQ